MHYNFLCTSILLCCKKKIKTGKAKVWKNDFCNLIKQQEPRTCLSNRTNKILVIFLDNFTIVFIWESDYLHIHLEYDITVSADEIFFGILWRI